MNLIKSIDERLKKIENTPVKGGKLDDIREENPEDKNLADELAKYASYRLNHFMDCHNLFKAEAMKMPQITEETVSMCMWNETHKMMQEWYDHIKSKIDKY